MAKSNEMSYRVLRKFVGAELNSILGGKEQSFSFLVEGEHGIGKSAFWKTLCIENDGYFIDLRLGQRDLGDIIGMPAVTVDDDGTKHMYHVKPELVRMAFVEDLSELGLMGDKGDVLSSSRGAKVGKPFRFILVFLDEYNRGSKDVQQAVFELVYDRRMNGDRVHPKTLIAAACNDNLEVYTITESDPAFRSRFRTIKFKPTVAEWLKWGDDSGELCPELIYTIRSKPDLADPPKKLGQDAIDFLNSPHPNRRSWHEASRFYAQFKDQFSPLEMRDCMACYVGGDAAEIFRLMVEKMKEQSLAKGDRAKVSENARIEEIYTEFIRFHRWDESQAKKAISGLNPSELQAFADRCISGFNTFNYVTSISKDTIISLSDIVPGEIFSKIWWGIDNSNGLREKMNSYAEKMGKAGHFNRFAKAKP